MPRTKRNRTAPFDLQGVAGMPNALKIYRIDALPYWHRLAQTRVVSRYR